MRAAWGLDHCLSGQRVAADGLSLSFVRKYSQYRQGQADVTQRYPQLRPALEQLMEAQDGCFELGHALVGAGWLPKGEGVFVEGIDQVLWGIASRMVDIIEAFLRDFDSWNLTMAIPAIRMQLDNQLRLTILHKTTPESGIIDALLSGEPLSKIRDPLAPKKKKFTLTDKRLREHAKERHPWIDALYDNCSHWVHFSRMHVDQSIDIKPDGSFMARIPNDPDLFSFDFLGEVLGGMLETTTASAGLLLSFVNAKRRRYGRPADTTRLGEAGSLLGLATTSAISAGLS
jgi:hypothetical protein